MRVRGCVTARLCPCALPRRDISQQRGGEEMAAHDIADWMLRLQDEGGCHNINFVTPEHVVPQVCGQVVPQVCGHVVPQVCEHVAVLDFGGWCVTLAVGVSHWRLVCHIGGWCVTLAVAFVS